MNDIDILEEMLKNTKTNRRGNKEIKFEVNSNYYKAILNLISENKELKENSIPKSKVEEAIYNGILEAKGWGCEDGAYCVEKELNRLLGKE